MILTKYHSQECSNVLEKKNVVPSRIELLILALLAPRLNQLGQGTYCEGLKVRAKHERKMLLNHVTKLLRNMQVRLTFYALECLDVQIDNDSAGTNMNEYDCLSLKRLNMSQVKREL